jgi:hypothetical protein
MIPTYDRRAETTGGMNAERRKRKMQGFKSMKGCKLNTKQARNGSTKGHMRCGGEEGKVKGGAPGEVSSRETRKSLAQPTNSDNTGQS